MNAYIKTITLKGAELSVYYCEECHEPLVVLPSHMTLVHATHKDIGWFKPLLEVINCKFAGYKFEYPRITLQVKEVPNT